MSKENKPLALALMANHVVELRGLIRRLPPGDDRKRMLTRLEQAQKDLELVKSKES
jgi:hypothetical protein